MNLFCITKLAITGLQAQCTVNQIIRLLGAWWRIGRAEAFRHSVIAVGSVSERLMLWEALQIWINTIQYNTQYCLHYVGLKYSITDILRMGRLTCDAFVSSTFFQQMFSEFVSSSAPFSIQATKTVRENIFNGLSRPTDELFDDAEKYTLMLLYAAWTHVIEHDLQTYDAVAGLLRCLLQSIIILTIFIRFNRFWSITLH